MAVIISKDPYEAAAAGEILEMEVLATIKDGRIIYRKAPV